MFLDSIYVLFFSESIGIKESIPQDFILGVGVEEVFLILRVRIPDCRIILALV